MPGQRHREGVAAPPATASQRGHCDRVVVGCQAARGAQARPVVEEQRGVGQARGLDQLHDREETRRCGQRSGPAERASMSPRGWWGCSPREEDSGAGSTPEKLAVSRTFFEGVRERRARLMGRSSSEGRARSFCSSPAPVAKASVVVVIRRARGDLGLSMGDRPGKAAASARARFWWGELLESAPAAGLWAESGGLPVS